MNVPNHVSEDSQNVNNSRLLNRTQKKNTVRLSHQSDSTDNTQQKFLKENFRYTKWKWVVLV